MPDFKSLWNIWLLIYIILINVYLAYESINSYIQFKIFAYDEAFGRNWNFDVCYIVLGSVIGALCLLPVTVYHIIVQNGNLADDNKMFGINDDTFHFIFTEKGVGKIMPFNRKAKLCYCIRSQLLKLIYMELPPISYLTQVLAAFCFMIPKPFIEALFIKNNVLKPNQLWHSDLDTFFQPDVQHADFTNNHLWDRDSPPSAAFLNLIISLVLLSLRYSRLFWHCSRAYAGLLSALGLAVSLLVLLETCALAQLVKVATNPMMLALPLRMSRGTSPALLLVLSIMARMLQLLSLTLVCHYGFSQYADAVLHARQHPIGIARRLRQPGQRHAFSPCLSEHNYSVDNYSGVGQTQGAPTGSQESVFSRGYATHAVAVLLIAIIAGLKGPLLYLSHRHIYIPTNDTLSLTVLVANLFFLFLWLIIWFAFALRRSWNFKAANPDSQLASPRGNGNLISGASLVGPMAVMNGDSLNGGGTTDSNLILFHGNGPQAQTGRLGSQMLMMQPQNSDLNLVMGSGATLPGSHLIHPHQSHQQQQQYRLAGSSGANDGCSDETDMSSRISSNNYVLMQSMRNGTLTSGGGGSATGGPQFGVSYDASGSLVRTPIYLSYANTGAANMPLPQQQQMMMQNGNIMMMSGQQQQQQGLVYANDEHNRASQMEEATLGSEHSFNSNRSRNFSPSFDCMPPILPNFDESRYKQMSPAHCSAAMDKLIPRYLKSPSIDGSSVQLLQFPNDLLPASRNQASVSRPILEYMQQPQNPGEDSKTYPQTLDEDDLDDEADNQNEDSSQPNPTPNNNNNEDSSISHNSSKINENGLLLEKEPIVDTGNDKLSDEQKTQTDRMCSQV